MKEEPQHLSVLNMDLQNPHIGNGKKSIAQECQKNEEAKEKLNLMEQNRMLLDILMTMHQ